MARNASRKRRRKSREFNAKATSSSDSEGGSDDDHEEEEASERRWQTRKSVAADNKGKGKAVVKEEDDESMSGSEDVEEQQQKADSQMEGDQVCGICLSEGGMERGKLDCCDHFFCFSCIMEWSKVESRCPMCKQRFVTVTKPAISGVTRSRSRTVRIPTRDQGRCRSPRNGMECTGRIQGGFGG